MTNPAAPPDRLLFAVTLGQFIAEYNDIAAFHREDQPGHPPDFWPPWNQLPPEKKEELIQDTAAAIKAILQRRSWNLLEESLYRAKNLPGGQPDLPRNPDSNAAPEASQ